MTAVFIDRNADLRRIMTGLDDAFPPDLAILDGNPSQAAVAEACREAEYVLVEHTAIPAEALRSAGRLKAVIFMGTGASSYIDLAVARELGIEVSTISGYADRAVAEHAFALMFAAARDVVRMDREIRAGEWSPRGGLQLAGRKVAVLGLGGIGTCFGRMAGAIGMNVAGWNRSGSGEAFFEPDLDAALDGADVVSMHLALNPQTERMITRHHLNLPKRGFIFVNTSRSQLVDEAALLEALDSRQIGHAALDVFEEEPLPSASPLRARRSLTLTAHAAYMSDDAYVELWRRTTAELKRLRSAA